jgi:putative hydrolase of the HAD superfamily
MSLIPLGVRAVFFDAVGTLLFPDPPAHEVYAAIAASQGVTLDPQQVRSRFWEAYRIEEAADRAANWATSEERERSRWWAIVTSALATIPNPEAGFHALWNHFAQPSAWRVNPDAAAVFATLSSRGLTLGLGTNYDSRVLNVVAGLPELTPLKDRVAVSGLIGWRKPAAQFFQEVIRLAGCSPGQLLFVGDDLENDYHGARAAGLQAILLNPKGVGETPHIARLAELAD